jgi:NADH-quinone oxidoreductase subunit G
MCDEGMLDYRRVHEDRIARASIENEGSTVGAALDRAAKALKGVAPDRLAVVLSAQHSNEDNFVFLKLAREVLGSSSLYLGGKPNGQGDQILREADKNPNTRGVAALAGSQVRSMQELGNAIAAGQISAVLALGSEVRDLADASGLGRVGLSVVLATHRGPLAERATVVLPTSSHAECDGTFVNAKGMAQESEQAIGPVGDSRPAWKLAAALSVRLGQDLGFRKLADVRAAMTRASTPPPSMRAAPAGAAS